jgi:hypothetical protein
MGRRKSLPPFHTVVINLLKIMNMEDVKKLIKENLKISVETLTRGSECSYNEKTYIKLIFLDEVISETEIEKLSEDR